MISANGDESKSTPRNGIRVAGIANLRRATLDLDRNSTLVGSNVLESRLAKTRPSPLFLDASPRGFLLPGQQRAPGTEGECLYHEIAFLTRGYIEIK